MIIYDFRTKRTWTRPEWIPSQNALREPRASYTMNLKLRPFPPRKGEGRRGEEDRGALPQQDESRGKESPSSPSIYQGSPKTTMIVMAKSYGVF